MIDKTSIDAKLDFQPRHARRYRKAEHAVSRDPAQQEAEPTAPARSANPPAKGDAFHFREIEFEQHFPQPSLAHPLHASGALDANTHGRETSRHRLPVFEYRELPDRIDQASPEQQGFTVVIPDNPPPQERNAHRAADPDKGGPAQSAGTSIISVLAPPAVEKDVRLRGLKVAWQARDLDSEQVKEEQATQNHAEPQVWPQRPFEPPIPMQISDSRVAFGFAVDESLPTDNPGHTQDALSDASAFAEPPNSVRNTANAWAGCIGAWTSRPSASGNSSRLLRQRECWRFRSGWWSAKHATSRNKSSTRAPAR